MIIADEVNDFGSRITLEVCSGRSFTHAITCGIPGVMVHTTFSSSEEDAKRKFEEMKGRLDAICKMDDPLPDIEAFVADF